LNETFLDDVFTALIFTEGQHISAIGDKASSVRLEVYADSSFREFVTYAPLDNNVVCLEPYTGTTNAVNLHNEGVDAGLVV
jgi:galactose mutarotase-like enzyme